MVDFNIRLVCLFFLFCTNRVSLSSYCLCITQMEQAKQELSRKDSELLALRTKLDTLNNQFSDSKQHVDVLKESLTAKEQRAAILQTEVKTLEPRTPPCIWPLNVCFFTSRCLCTRRWMPYAFAWKRRSLFYQKRASRYLS